MPQVAEVYADLKFRVQGTGDVTASTRSVQRAMAEVQKAATSASAEVRVAGRELKASIDQVTAAARDAEAANAKISAAGDTIESLGQQVQQAGTRLQGMRADMASLESQTQGVSRAMKEIDGETRAFIENMVQGGASTQALSSVVAQATGVSREAARAWAEQSKEIIKLKNDIESLKESMGEDAELLGTAQGLGVDEALADMEKQRRGLERTQRRAGDLSEGFDKVRGSSRRMNGALALNRTTLRGLVTSLRSGRVSSSLFAGGLRSIAAAASTVSLGVVGVAAAIAALPFAAVFAGWKVLNSEWAASADRLNTLNPRVVQLSRNMEVLSRQQGVGNLAGQLDEAIRRFQSFGIDRGQSTAIAGRIAEAANFAQFLDPAKDASQVFQDIQRSVESLSFDNLRSLGINVNELEESMRRLASQGIPEAARQGEALDMIFAQLAGNADRVEAAVRRQHDSFAGLKADIASIFRAVSESETFRNAIKSLTGSFREWLPLIAGVAKLIGIIVVGVAKVAEWMTTVIDKGWMFFGLVGGFVKLMTELGESTEGVAGAFGDILPPGLEEKIKDILDGAKGGFDEVIEGAEEAKSAVEAFSDTTSTMRGFEGQIRGIVQSFGAMKDALDPGEVTDFVGNLAGALDFIGQRGAANVRASLEAEADLLKQFFDQGFLSLEQYQRGLEELEAKRAFADPLIRKVEEMERGFEDGKTAAERAASGIDSTTVAASTATSQVETLIGTLGSIPSDVGTNIHIGVSGPGAALLGGGGIAVTNPITGEVDMMNRGRRGPASSVGTRNVTSAAPGTPGGIPTGRHTDTSATIGADRGLARMAEEVQARKNAENLENLFDSRGSLPGGGGGGGGGSQGASIEQIREFFRQVNAVIMSGIRGGKIFSTAGNAIPVGAPGEFLNTKGGALIQTVNIRGVWDFADPAAKRQIIKELEESLAGLKREVA